MGAGNRALDLLSQQFNGLIVVVDVGAADRFKDLPRLAPCAELHLVEPRQETTEPNQGGFARIVQHNVALAGAVGERTLHLTANGYASSMLPPNVDVIERWRPECILPVTGEVKLQCITLDDLAQRAGITTIDYLKLDTQGTELEIMRGGAETLTNTSVIRVEVEFIPLYQGQPLYGEVSSFLHEHGFDFIDFSDGERFGGPDRAKRIWADALFVRRGLRGSQLLKATAVLIELGYWTDAAWMMEDGGIDPNIVRQMPRLIKQVPDDMTRGAHRRTPKNFAKFLLGRLPR